jgi:hypothetical protein
MLNVGAPWLQSPANVAANVGWHQCWKGRSKGRGIEKNWVCGTGKTKS